MHILRSRARRSLTQNLWVDGGCDRSFERQYFPKCSFATALDIRTSPWFGLTTHLEVEVQHYDHLPVTGLEDGVLDVVVEDVHLVATHRCEAEAWTHGEYNSLATAAQRLN